MGIFEDFLSWDDSTTGDCVNLDPTAGSLFPRNCLDQMYPLCEFTWMAGREIHSAQQVIIRSHVGNPTMETFIYLWYWPSTTGS